MKYLISFMALMVITVVASAATVTIKSEQGAPLAQVMVTQTPAAVASNPLKSSGLLFKYLI